MDRAEAGRVVGRLRTLSQKIPSHKGKQGKRLAPAVKENIERDLRAATKKHYEIARDHGVSKSTVSSIAEELLYQPTPDDPEELTFRTHGLKQPHLCAKGHRTTFSPCVACAAERQKQAIRQHSLAPEKPAA